MGFFVPDMISADPDEFVRQLADEITHSPEEAAKAMKEMQKDIGRCAAWESTDDPKASHIPKGMGWRRIFNRLR